MTTILSAYNSDKCIGRCDARCHEAQGGDCHCICGGAFHGVGSRIATEDRQTLSDDEIKETIGNNRARIKRLPVQGSLFDQGA